MSKVYDIITERVVKLLEQGVVPWHKPWQGQEPRNLVSGKVYRGINWFLLSCCTFESPYFLTFRQCKAKGGYVRKGERGFPVVFYTTYEARDKDADTGEETTKERRVLRYYTVFNVEQCEGVDIPLSREIQSFEHEPVETAEKIVNNMPDRPRMEHGGNRAFYNPAGDFVQLPPQSYFEIVEEYYCATFHELVHSTGHASRIGRKGIEEPSYFGGHEYSKEELIAEMGAAFLCGKAEVVNKTIQNSAAYIAGWLKRLRSDKRLVVYAAAAAQKAADFILG